MSNLYVLNKESLSLVSQASVTQSLIEHLRKAELHVSVEYGVIRREGDQPTDDEIRIGGDATADQVKATLATWLPPRLAARRNYPPTRIIVHRW
jgi:hypothetical protein